MIINNMKFSNVIQSICSAPAIMLDDLVTACRDFLYQEKELIKNGELDEETIEEEQEEQEQTPH